MHATDINVINVLMSSVRKIKGAKSFQNEVP